MRPSAAAYYAERVRLISLLAFGVLLRSAPALAKTANISRIPTTVQQLAAGAAWQGHVDRALADQILYLRTVPAARAPLTDPIRTALIFPTSPKIGQASEPNLESIAIQLLLRAWRGNKPALQRIIRTNSKNAEGLPLALPDGLLNTDSMQSTINEILARPEDGAWADASIDYLALNGIKVAAIPNGSNSSSNMLIGKHDQRYPKLTDWGSHEVFPHPNVKDALIMLGNEKTARFDSNFASDLARMQIGLPYFGNQIIDGMAAHVFSHYAGNTLSQLIDKGGITVHHAAAFAMLLEFLSGVNRTLNVDSLSRIIIGTTPFEPTYRAYHAISSNIADRVRLETLSSPDELESSMRRIKIDVPIFGGPGQMSIWEFNRWLNHTAKTNYGS